MVLVYFKSINLYWRSYASFWYPNVDYNNCCERNPRKKYCPLWIILCFRFCLRSFNDTTDCYTHGFTLYRIILTDTFVWALIFLVKNSWPTQDERAIQSTSYFRRFVQAGKIAWVAMIPCFGYGFLEAALHGTFPIYGLRL